MLYQQQLPDYQLDKDKMYDAAAKLSEADQTKLDQSIKDLKRELDTISSMRSAKYGGKKVTASSGIGRMGIMEIIYRLSVHQIARENQGVLGGDLRLTETYDNLLK